MLTATISKEWGEVGVGSSKCDGWSWEVAFFADDKMIDRHYYKTQLLAENAVSLFESGLYYTSSYGGVEFEEC